MRRLYLTCLCFLIVLNGFAQTRAHWEQVVHWDGVSDWSRYMITLPGYQGPNSLPVPSIANGSIDSTTYLSLAGDLHFSKGDNTQNPILYGNLCLVKDLISFDMMFVPCEHYDMTPAMKDKRHVYSKFYNDNSAVGDVHLSTRFQIFNKWRKHIQLALRIGYRFPSGNGFGAARYSDGPGYFFDASFGKPFRNTKWKWTGMAGFYVWQIESDVFNQDDAFMFGTGLEYADKGWLVKGGFAGYLGYIYHSGDKPMVLRASVEKRIKNASYFTSLQRGIHDFTYTSVEAGFRYFFRNTARRVVISKE